MYCYIEQVPTLLSDETWTQLDPHAGRLSSRQARRMVAWVLSGVTVALAGVGVWFSGAVVPQLEAEAASSYSIEPGRFTYEVVVMNTGWTEATVLDIGQSGPGLELTGVSMQGPITLARHTGIGLVLSYRVTD